MGSDGWQILAALATTASAAVIAWQAWLTRRSLKTTDQALKEAQRARIDAGAPTSILLGFPDVAGGPQGYVLPRPNQTDPVEEMGAGTVLAMPGDGDRVLAVNTRVDIHNVGAVPAYVTTSLPVVPIWNGNLQDMPPATREVLLPAGAHWEGWVVVEHTLATWVDRLDAVGPESVPFSVEYNGPRDEDVRIVARALIAGTPISREQYNGSAYRMRPNVTGQMLAGQPLGVERSYRLVGR